MKNKTATTTSLTASALALALSVQSTGGATISQADDAYFNNQDGFEQIIRDRTAMGPAQMLGDQAPASAWSIVPVKSADGSVACVGSLTLNFDEAKVTNANGTELTAEEKKELRHNTAYIKIEESGPTFAALVKIGFGADAGQTSITIDGADAALTQIANDGYTITDSVAAAEGQSIIVTSTSNANEPHTVEYAAAEQFPLETFVECNNTAFIGGFDAAFDAIDNNTIMVIDLPQGEHAQALIKEEFTAGGLCTAGFKPEEYGDIEFSRTWLPSTIAGITRDENGAFNGIAVGDLLKGSANRLSRSQSLANPEISACAGQAPQICVETNEANGTLTLSFCEAAPSAYIPPSISTPETLIRVTQLVDTPTYTNPPRHPFVPGNPHYPNLPEQPTPCLIGCNPIDPVDPIDPIDPIDPVTPAPVPLPAGIVLMGTALAGFGVAAVGNRLRRRKENAPQGNSTETSFSAPEL